MSNTANKVKVTIKKPEPQPDTVILEMPSEIAQGLMDVISKVSTRGRLGSLSYEVFKGLWDADIRPNRSCIKRLNELGIVEFID